MNPKKRTEKHIKLHIHKGTKNEGEVKLEKAKDQKGFGFTPNKKDVEPAKEKKPQAAQPNLFGEQDAAYNTIQEEITIVADEMQGCRDAIEKKEDRLTHLIGRKGKLDRAAETVAKLRDGALKKKAKGEKEKASWPAENKGGKK